MSCDRLAAQKTDGAVTQGAHVDVKPVAWHNLLGWIQDTRRHARRVYRRKDRPLTLRRLLGVISPRLDRPVFIIGSPRSGTTFLGDCMAPLPEVSYHHEPVLTKAASRYVYEKAWPATRASRVYRLVYKWLVRLRADGDLRFCEKTPINCFIIPFLAGAFPDAQFVHILRDGRDAALSHAEKPWLQAASAGSGRREPGGYLYGPYPRFWVEPERRDEFSSTSDLHRCVWAWRRHVQTAIENGRVLPEGRYMELRYESLVSAPDREANRLLDFLEIAAVGSRETLLAEARKARANSVGRWRTGLSEADRGMVRLEAGKLLEDLGYGW